MITDPLSKAEDIYTKIVTSVHVWLCDSLGS